MQASQVSNLLGFILSISPSSRDLPTPEPETACCIPTILADAKPVPNVHEDTQIDIIKRCLKGSGEVTGKLLLYLIIAHMKGNNAAVFLPEISGFRT